MAGAQSTIQWSGFVAEYAGWSLLRIGGIIDSIIGLGPVYFLSRAWLSDLFIHKIDQEQNAL